MSRVGRRSGTKSLVCMECQRRIKGRTGSTPRTVMSFRGYSQARLDKHLREVHGKTV